MKVIINKCYGRYGLKPEILKQLGLNNYYKTRTNEDLIRMIEEGRDISGRFAELKVVEIPDDVEYIIEEYDGIEWIAEKHRIWE